MENVPKKKKPIYKRWWFWIIAIIFIFWLIGAVGRKDVPQKVSSAPAPTKTATTTSQNKTASSKTQIFKIGDTVQLKDYKFTVNKIRTSAGSDMDKPKDGNEFLYVDCTVENISKEDKVVSSVMMFKVEDKDGRSYDQALTTDTNGQLDGTVGAGRKITGEYVVQVPKDKTGLDLAFNATELLNSKQIIVQLN